ncbi:DUF4232 domain-containing protein [Actinoplanes couchii]|uniref:DUF4232 domain-containing protein n=1 Tax=Actinoplanes couchii TaxID=403638 RepID=A0ABQ3X710_9ACTN|nr:DUF4232 domain-containing protein [Actinoplanes couchii]MDR6322136.1 hypothetical protein [Actinoplanes couchii]GID54301.1 hypothetical protein Aco03nite_027050 [Actinoplanes couchii]
MRRSLLLLVVLALGACSIPAPLKYQPGPDNRPEPPEPTAATSASVSASASGAVAVPECVRGSRITVGDGSAAMGLRAVGIELHNCGTAAFDVEGYPVLEVLGPDRQALDVRTLHGVDEVSPIDQWMVAPERVTVRPGKSARALLVWRNLTTDKAVTGAFVSVAVGDGQPAQVRELSVDVGSTGRVAVSPWVAGGSAP